MSWKIQFSLTREQAAALRAYLRLVADLGPDVDDPDLEIPMFKLIDHLEVIINDPSSE